MSLRLIICDGVGPAGQPCGHIAKIVDERHVQMSGSLVEMHRVIECPECGVREVVLANGQLSRDHPRAPK